MRDAELGRDRGDAVEEVPDLALAVHDPRRARRIVGPVLDPLGVVGEEAEPRLVVTRLDRLPVRREIEAHPARLGSADRGCSGCDAHARLASLFTHATHAVRDAGQQTR